MENIELGCVYEISDTKIYYIYQQTPTFPTFPFPRLPSKNSLEKPSQILSIQISKHNLNFLYFENENNISSAKFQRYLSHHRPSSSLSSRQHAPLTYVEGKEVRRMLR